MFTEVVVANNYSNTIYDAFKCEKYDVIGKNRANTTLITKPEITLILANIFIVCLLMAFLWELSCLYRLWCHIEATFESVYNLSLLLIKLEQTKAQRNSGSFEQKREIYINLQLGISKLPGVYRMPEIQFLFSCPLKQALKFNCQYYQ